MLVQWSGGGTKGVLEGAELRYEDDIDVEHVVGGTSMPTGEVIDRMRKEILQCQEDKIPPDLCTKKIRNWTTQDLVKQLENWRTNYSTLNKKQTFGSNG